MARPELSLVIPIFNEEEVLPQLDVRVQELLRALAIESEVVFVNDGSRDRSMDLLRDMATRDPRYKVVGFARNFGHQRAITAGMDAARGRAVVVMDADLQDPPEVILEMVARWREGFDVVYGRRRKREGETPFKLFTAKLFYRLFAAMIPIEVPLDTGDFRLMSRRVVLAMRELRETHRFVRGLVAWVGFRQCAVEYDRAARAAGETKYPLKKMVSFALDGIASFSILPLRAATYIGLLVGAASVLYAFAAVVTHLFGMTVPGWTTTVVLVSFLFSVQLLLTGVLGEYVGRIYEQVKGRPLYVVADRVNFAVKKKKRKKARESRRDTVEVSHAGQLAAFGVSPTAVAMPTPLGLGPVATGPTPPNVTAPMPAAPTTPMAAKPKPATTMIGMTAPQPFPSPAVVPIPSPSTAATETAKMPAMGSAAAATALESPAFPGPSRTSNVPTAPSSSRTSNVPGAAPSRPGSGQVPHAAPSRPGSGQVPHAAPSRPGGVATSPSGASKPAAPTPSKPPPPVASKPPPVPSKPPPPVASKPPPPVAPKPDVPVAAPFELPPTPPVPEVSPDPTPTTPGDVPPVVSNEADEQPMVSDQTPARRG